MNQTDEDECVRVTLFGPAEIRRGDLRVRLSPREQCLLAALVSAEGRAVSRDLLPDWIWDDVPDGVRTELEKLMTRLREDLRKVGLPDALVNQNGRCRLVIPHERVDIHRFRALVSESETAEEHRAGDLLREALDLSRGEPFTGLHTQPINNYRIALLEERRRAELRLSTVEIDLGHAEVQIPRLAQLFQERREDTAITELYMRALHLAHRPKDALEVFKKHREELDTVGLEVDRSVKELQLRILRENAEQDVHLTAEPQRPENTVENPARRPDRVNRIRQTADHMNIFEERVDARGAHFGPRYGEERRTVDD